MPSPARQRTFESLFAPLARPSNQGLQISAASWLPITNLRRPQGERRGTELTWDLALGYHSLMGQEKVAHLLYRLGHDFF